MKKVLVVLSICGVTFFLAQKVTLSHCEIPCGIYGDELRIGLMYEDIATVEKSMKQIIALKDSDDINANQIVRWINNKEEHCNKLQHVVTQYWMTQRVKPADPSSKDAHGKYLRQLELLHNMLVQAMKSKQTTDVQHTAALRKLVDQFAETYFSAETLKHLRSHHGAEK